MRFEFVIDKEDILPTPAAAGGKPRGGCWREAPRWCLLLLLLLIPVYGKPAKE
jgi:hypothetical protein